MKKTEAAYRVLSLKSVVSKQYEHQDSSKMPCVSAILLAGGLSRRMGGRNKLYLNINGMTLLRHNVELLQKSRLNEIVVVLGYQSEKSQTEISRTEVNYVVNPNYRRGQMTSVHHGLKSLQKPCEGIMVALADQPALTVNNINALIAAFAKRDDKSVVVPMYRGQPGNPIVISTDVRDDIVVEKANFGCRRFIEKHPESVMTWEVSEPAFVLDLDTPEDYQAYCEQMGFANRSSCARVRN